jgi:hypothetical protein
MKTKHKIVSNETKEKIIEHWKFSKINSVPIIAEKFNLKQGIVNTIINEYLSSKI